MRTHVKDRWSPQVQISCAKPVHMGAVNRRADRRVGVAAAQNRGREELINVWLGLQQGVQLLTQPVYTFPGRVSRNLNYGASLPLIPLGTGDQPVPEWLVTLWLARTAGQSPCGKRFPVGMPWGTRLGSCYQKVRVGRGSASRPAKDRGWEGLRRQGAQRFCPSFAGSSGRTRAHCLPEPRLHHLHTGERPVVKGTRAKTA